MTDIADSVRYSDLHSYFILLWALGVCTGRGLISLKKADLTVWLFSYGQLLAFQPIVNPLKR